jgi:hypothetical protein
MSNPQWRDRRPSSPYGGEPGDGTRGRDTRAPGGDPRVSRRDPRDGSGQAGRQGDPRLGGPSDDAATRRMPAQAGLTQPTAPPPSAPRFTPAPPGGGARRDAVEGGRPRGRGTDHRPREQGGRLSRVWEGSLRGGLGVCVIAGSAAIGAAATIVTHNQPGSMLGLFVLAGTVAAALTVQPRTGRLIFPVPALSYLVAALVAGVAYDRSADKTVIAVGTAQWIANGFFVMVLATLLAIALTTVRWFMWRRDQRDPAAPDRAVQQGPSAGPPRTSAGPPRPPTAPRPPGPQPRTQPTRWPPVSAGPWDQGPGPRPDQRPGWAPDQRPRSAPYNFSSGA